MRVSETVGKGRLTLLCERLELPSFVFNALVRHVPASFHTAPQLAPLFLSTLFSALYLFALTLESYSFIPPIVCLPGAISLRNSWEINPGAAFHDHPPRTIFTGRQRRLPEQLCPCRPQSRDNNKPSSSRIRSQWQRSRRRCLPFARRQHRRRRNV